MKSTQPVSSELFVAMMIYHVTEIKKERVWTGKLVNTLQEYMTKLDVHRVLTVLTDWMIITGEYGETEKGRGGYLYYIETHDGGDLRIKELYDKYWVHITGDNNG
jgi:hypothetical protein